MNPPIHPFASSPQALRPRFATVLLSAGLGLLLALNATAQAGVGDQAGASSANLAPSSLEEMRLAMGKWIETQQIVAKERKDWQQGKELLTSRLDLVKKEIATIEQKLAEAQSSAEKAQQKRDELLAQNELHKTATAQLVQKVTAMEGEIRRLLPNLPEPVQATVQKLFQRMPTDPANVRVSAAERCQNVLGILAEVNKANSEITLNFEVRTLALGKRSEVQAIYIGLGQAYYVSADGDAGIGRPGPDGWQWEPSAAVSRDLVMALEILQGKQTAAFVPLPVVLQ